MLQCPMVSGISGVEGMWVAARVSPKDTCGGKVGQRVGLWYARRASTSQRGQGQDEIR
jgi:hypothetical protein